MRLPGTASVPVRLARRRSIAGPIPVVSFELGFTDLPIDEEPYHGR